MTETTLKLLEKTVGQHLQKPLNGVVNMLAVKSVILIESKKLHYHIDKCCLSLEEGAGYKNISESNPWYIKEKDKHIQTYTR